MGPATTARAAALARRLILAAMVAICGLTAAGCAPDMPPARAPQTALGCVSTDAPDPAQRGQKRFDIAPGLASSTLTAWATQSGYQLSLTKAAGSRAGSACTPQLAGYFDPLDALQCLLAATPLILLADDPGQVTIGALPGDGNGVDRFVPVALSGGSEASPRAG